MLEQDNKRREQVALFRYGVIGDLVHREPGSKGLYELLRQKAAQNYVIPDSPRTTLAVETIRDWLKDYRKGGYDALQKPRGAQPEAVGLRRGRISPDAPPWP